MTTHCRCAHGIVWYRDCPWCEDESRTVTVTHDDAVWGVTFERPVYAAERKEITESLLKRMIWR